MATIAEHAVFHSQANEQERAETEVSCYECTNCFHVSEQCLIDVCPCGQHSRSQGSEATRNHQLGLMPRDRSVTSGWSMSTFYLRALTWSHQSLLL